MPDLAQAQVQRLIHLVAWMSQRDSDGPVRYQDVAAELGNFSVRLLPLLAACFGLSFVYLTLPNYQNNWKWLGFEDADFANGGSDRLIDAVVAWGDERAIAARIQAHFDAGADHVAIQAFRPDGEPGPDMSLGEAAILAAR